MGESGHCPEQVSPGVLGVGVGSGVWGDLQMDGAVWMWS